MPELKLWYAPGACSLATHIALQETGIPFVAVDANVPSAKSPINLPEYFTAINPKKRVPVLHLDGEIITEAPAILLAISTLAPELNLYGADTLERIRVAEWLNWLSGTLHSQGFGAFFRPERYSDDASIHSQIRKHAANTIVQIFGDIDAKLEGKEFAVGGHFTVVDAFLFPFWRWGKNSRFKMENRFPNYTKLITRVRERSSTKAALKTEGLSPADFGSAEGKL